MRLEDDCALGSESEILQLPDGLIPVCWLEQNHIDPGTKVANVCHLTGLAREKEIQKTETLCLLHHHQITRIQRKVKPPKLAKKRGRF